MAIESGSNRLTRVGIVVGGGPAPGINGTIGAVTLEASNRGREVVGICDGFSHLMTGCTERVKKLQHDDVSRIHFEGGSILATSRANPTKNGADLACVVASLKTLGIGYLVTIGGDDTMYAASQLAQASAGQIRVCHVPKTIDNDLLENDHTPGFPSAARYVTLALMGDALDNASLGGIKINVIMGRNAGFLTAAASLARGAASNGASPADRAPPHLIYLPEVPFSTDTFLADVESVYAKLGRCQIAVSEGIRDGNGEEIGPKLMRGPGEVDAHGNVQLSGSGALGDGLADLVKTGLTPKGGKAPRVRADTFGYIQRCWPHPSSVDAEEARAVGRYAAELAAKGDRSASVIILRTSNAPEAYRSAIGRADLSAVARRTRHVPPEFISGSNDVSAAFHAYCRPLVGELPTMERI